MVPLVLSGLLCGIGLADRGLVLWQAMRHQTLSAIVFLGIDNIARLVSATMRGGAWHCSIGVGGGARPARLLALAAIAT